MPSKTVRISDFLNPRWNPSFLAITIFTNPQPSEEAEAIKAEAEAIKAEAEKESEEGVEMVEEEEEVQEKRKRIDSFRAVWEEPISPRIQIQR